MFIYLAMSIIGTIIDMLFITNISQAKNPLTKQKYLLMIALMIIIMLAPFVFYLKVYSTIIRIVLLFIIMFIFTKQLVNLGYLSFSFALLCIFDIFIYSVLNFNYNVAGLINIIIKLFFTVIVFKRINFECAFKDLNTITKKFLFVLFSFICLATGFYIIIAKGGN